MTRSISPTLIGLGLVLSLGIFFGLVASPLIRDIQAHGTSIIAAKQEAALTEARLRNIERFRTLRYSPDLQSAQEEVATYQDRIRLLEEELNNPESARKPDRLAALKKKIAEYQASLAKLQQGVTISGEKARSTAPLLQIKSFFADSETPVEFIIALEQLAAATHTPLVIASVPVATTPQGQRPIPQLRFALTVQGTFADVDHFVTMIEQIPYLVAIETVTIAPEKSPGGGSSSPTDIPTGTSRVESTITINVQAAG